MGLTMMDEIGEIIAQGIDPRDCEDDLRARYGRTCAVLVIDSSGFTSTTRECGIMYVLGKLQQMREAIIPVLKKHQCITYITEADSFIALFPSVTLAFAAVLESAQDVCDRKIMFTPERPYGIEAGIGYGSLLVTGGHGEFFGPEMNLASKLGEDTAQANQLLITDAAHAALPDSQKKLFRRGAEIISGNDINYHALAMEDHYGLLPCAVAAPN